MTHPHKPALSPRSLVSLAVAAALALASLPRSASADLVVTAQSVTGIAPGSSGNALQVVLQNTGPAAVSLAGFSFGLSVTNVNIVFTSVDISTALPYIFAGNSAFGPNIDTTAGAQTVVASDLYATFGSDVSIGSGVSVGLGRVLFNAGGAIAPGTVVPITLTAPPTTSFSDKDGNAPPVTVTLTTGTSITIAGTSAIPEPSVITLAGVAGLILVGRTGLKRIRDRRAA